MAKATKGPGGPQPVNPLAAMIKEALRRREEAKMAKSQGMSEPGKVVRSDKKVGTEGYLNEGQFLEESGKIRSRAKEAPMSRAESIKEGFFTEKNGDLTPTAKYEEYKKSGKYSKFVK